MKINNVQKNDMPPIIKVVGVGGGGGNAVNYMYNLNVPDVTYLLCNTDRQHLNTCDVPDTICIGEQKASKGLGAGNKPEVARVAAEESANEVREALSDGTQMVFITAGMGGGTGTGAAPVIARIAKEMDILTVGIVTIPFLFEGRAKILRAIEGVEKMSKNVDAILVVKNELLMSVYPDMTLKEAFKKADETLTTSTRSISETITIPGIINVDFADVRTTLKDGGVAIITRGFASKDEGVEVAMERALQSPLLNTSDFDRAERVLFQINYKKDCEPKTGVAETLRERLTVRLGVKTDIIWGLTEREDQEMLDDVGFILLASGFSTEDMHLDAYAKNTLTAEEQEEEERKDELIRAWYPEYDPATVSRIRYRPVIFSDDELNDNMFIATIIETPTLKRKDSVVSELRARKRESTSPEKLLREKSAPSVSPSKSHPQEPKIVPPQTNDGIERADEVITF